jgi:hypothetical protein
LIITFKIQPSKKKILLLKKAVTIGFGNVCHDAWNEPVSSFHYWWHAARINVMLRLNLSFSGSNYDGSYMLFCILENLRNISTERLRIDFEI